MTKNAGRPPGPAAQAPTDTLNDEALLADSAALTTLSAAQMMVVDHQELFKLIGRLEAADFYRNISEKLMIDLYEMARSAFTTLGEVTYRLPNGTVTRFANVNEFCRAVFHRSERRVQQIAASNRLLGEELYAQSRELGLRERDYRAIKALPAPEQQAVRAAIEANDKQAVMDIIKAIAERQTALERANNELSAEATHHAELIDKKDKTINILNAAEERRRSGSADEREKALLAELRASALALDQYLLRTIAVVDEAMSNAPTEATELCARQTLDYIVQRLADTCAERRISIDVLGERVEPGWLRPMTEAVSAAKTAGKQEG